MAGSIEIPIKLYRKELEMPESEKVTINMNVVDLGKVETLVQEGVYANRTDFIRTAIRNLLDKHSLEIEQTVVRNSYAIGVLVYDRSDLEKAKAKNERLAFKIIGLLSLDKDIPVDLAKEVIEYIQVRGVFTASEPVKTALADRIR